MILTFLLCWVFGFGRLVLAAFAIAVGDRWRLPATALASGRAAKGSPCQADR